MSSREWHTQWKKIEMAVDACLEHCPDWQTRRPEMKQEMLKIGEAIVQTGIVDTELRADTVAMLELLVTMTGIIFALLARSYYWTEEQSKENAQKVMDKLLMAEEACFSTPRHH